MEFTNMLLVVSLEVMLLKSLDGELKMELTTGYVLTHGEIHGVLTDSSRSREEIVVLTTQCMHAPQIPLASVHEQCMVKFLISFKLKIELEIFIQLSFSYFT
jgi:hypothetical protein